MARFTGKCVLITGGTKGIGKACAVQFAREGARLVLTYAQDEQAAERTRRDGARPEQRHHEARRLDGVAARAEEEGEEREDERGERHEEHAREEGPEGRRQPLPGELPAGSLLDRVVHGGAVYRPP